MNRSYRVLWNESRQQLVVASEMARAGGKGKSRGVVSRVLCAAVLIGGLLTGGSGEALADTCAPGLTTVNALVDGQCIVTGTDSVTVTAAGTLTDTLVTFPGTISVDAAATGVVIDNSGNITNTTQPAINVNTAATGTQITNQLGGQISAVSSSTRIATAIHLGFDFGGALTNNGAINATATSPFQERVFAYGVRGGTFSNMLTNTGTISASATVGNLSTSSSIDARAYGVLSSTLSGMLTNSGTISGTATNNGNNTGNTYSISVTAYGVNASTLSGMLTNSGAISGTATNNGTASSTSVSVQAFGVHSSTLSGTLTNTGTISASAANNGTGSWETVRASGVFASTLSGTLNNSGTISASASNAGSSTRSVYARGVNISTLTGTGVLTNSGTITAGGTGTASASFAGVYIGSGSMQGGATLNNSGTISATSNNSGGPAYSLHILNNPCAAAATVNNLAGGLMRGNLLVLNPFVAVNNAGTIDLPNNGAANSIAGDYTQQLGGVLRIGATSTVSYSQLSVTGTADLTASGAFDVDVAGINTLANGNVLTGVLTAGTLNIGAIPVTDNSLIFDFTGAVDGAGTGVDLTIVAAGGGGGGSGTVLDSVVATGFTPGVGAAVVYDNLIAAGPSGGDMDNVITALGTLATQQQVSNAVAASVPLLTGETPLSMLGVNRGIGHTYEARLAAMQGMASGDGYLTDGKLWFKPFASFASQDGRNAAFGFDADTYGLAVGMDKEISGQTNMVLGFSWSRSFVDSKDAPAVHSADIDSYQLAASASYNFDADTFIIASVNGGLNQNDGERRISFGGLNRVASSSYDSWSAHVGAEIGRRYAISEGVSVTPTLRVDYSVVRDDAYIETGAGALNLNVGSNTSDELLLGADAKLGYALSDAARFSVRLGGAYDALSEQESITSTFAGAPAALFTTLGVDPTRWLGRGGADLTIKASDSVDITAGYAAEVRQDFYNQTGSLKLVWAF